MSVLARGCCASRLGLRPGLGLRPYHSQRDGVFGYNPIAWNKLRQDNHIPIDYAALSERANILRFVSAYRKHGHKHANINPVPIEGLDVVRPSNVDVLKASSYRLDSNSVAELSGIVESLGKEKPVALADLENFLVATYCGPLTAEFDSVEDESELQWLWNTFEEHSRSTLTSEEKQRLAKEMLRSQNFDNYMATKFSNVKRYGGEGAEAMMAFFIELIGAAGQHKIEEYVIGMPHRGRLNLMTGLFKFPPVKFFRKMKGLSEFPPGQEKDGAGDVLSHFTSSVDLPTALGGTVHVTMLPNPSHLECVNPLACGKARARYLSRKLADYSDASAAGDVVGGPVVCIQVHGDAAMIGQGINQETLQFSQVPHFSCGGSIHFVVNNQVGFTTPGDRGRSGRYCTDIAKQVGAPVIHVNGDFPEEVVKATRIAIEYQRRYRKDVFIDMMCYRRHGHNELDDPTFTNPLLYKTIEKTRTLPDAYADQMVDQSVLSREEAEATLREHTDYCNAHFQQIESYSAEQENLKSKWSGIVQAPHALTHWDTGLPIDLLKFIGGQSVKRPDDFNLHPHLNKIHVSARLKRLEEGSLIDWGLAEALAIGSLLYQGYNVRISGQDVGRATFAHRHAMLVDQDSNEMYIPFNDMEAHDGIVCGNLEMANSPLSEEAVLGFEYGMSVESPQNFIIWEAQFGDFFNGAQIILDTYVAAAESKWGMHSGLTMLLPHGMDGAGPEHSSCRLERFLQMSDSREAEVDGDNVNWQVVNPTNAAQYFHLLRRQMVRNFRKPLVVVGPKILLRLPAAASALTEMAPGTSFQPVLGANTGPESSRPRDPKKVKRVILTSGKHYYALAKHATESRISGETAIIRLEQLCPFPTKELQDEIGQYPNAKEFVWSQEEHRNMGAWAFVAPRFRNLVGIIPRYSGRAELCQPAVGVGQVHQAEAKHVIEDAFQ